MEPKKNPKYDVHRKRNLIFNFSLVLSLLIVISAFRIAVPYREDGCDFHPPEEWDAIVPPIPVTTHNEKKIEPLPTRKTMKAPVPDFTRIRVADSNSPTTTVPVIDTAPTDVPDLFGTVSVPLEIDTTTFLIVEKPPVPEGGYPAFYQILRDNIQYPRKAKARETTGKVFVEFTVDRSGELRNIHVIKGIGDGCDEEAMRVIRLTRWEPGKQRGKAVRVKMVLPVVFEMRR